MKDLGLFLTNYSLFNFFRGFFKDVGGIIKETADVLHEIFITKPGSIVKSRSVLHIKHNVITNQPTTITHLKPVG